MEDYRNHTFEAECRLLCELAASPADLPTIRQSVRAEMFQDNHTRQLWRILCDLFDEGAPIDSIILYQRAPEKNWYQENILNLTPSGSFLALEEYAAALVSGYQSGRVYALAEKLREEAVRGTTATRAMEIIGEYENDLAATAQPGRKTISAVEAYNNLCEELQAGRGCVPTGFPSLDLATYGGFEDGNLVIIAARPSVGKTALSLFLARNMAAAGKRVVFFSLEMTAPELIKRICIGTGCVQAKDFRREALNWQAIEKAAATFEKVPLFINDTARRLEDIRAEMVLESSRHGLDAVFVDYLGLVRSSKDDRTPQYLKIAEITGRMKELAKELHIPVILLCQLNREADKAGREPQLFDLRDSGAIEQDADIGIMLHQEEEASRRISVLVEKNRHGRKDFRFELERNESYTRFEEITPNE